MTPTHEPPMDQDMTPQVRDWLRETALTGPDAARGLDRLLNDFPTTPQRRRWWRIAWPNRGRDVSRSVTGRGTTSHGRSSAMFGPFRLAVASVILVIVGGFALVRLAEPPSPPVLLAGATLVVAQDDSGDFTSITAAVAAAADGDTIEIMPGHYLESVAVVGKDVTIIGVGDRGDVIVEAASAPTPDSPADEPHIFDWAFFLLDTSSTLSNLTIIGQQEGTAIPIVGDGSAPILDGLVIRLNGQWSGNHSPVWWGEGTSGTLRNSVAEGWMGMSANTDVVIEDNQLPSTCIVVWDTGAHATIRRNTIRDCRMEAGIQVKKGSALIEGNDISVAEAPPGTNDNYSEWREAVMVTSLEGTSIVRDNDIHDSLVGISTASGVEADVSGNRFTSNDIGVSASSDLTTVSGNTITGGKVGVLVLGGSPTLDGNTITGNEQGIVAGPRTHATLTGNTVCDNGINLKYTGKGDPPATKGNEICPDPSPSPGASPGG